MKKYFLILLFGMFLFMISCGKSGNEIIKPNPINNDTIATNTVSGNGLNAQTMLSLVNASRAKGCTCGSTAMPVVGLLSWNGKLEQISYNHSLDMKTRNFFADVNPDGLHVWDRANAVGYTFTAIAESIGVGYSTELELITVLLANEKHCKNLMNGAVTQMGAGQSNAYWTIVYGKP